MEKRIANLESILEKLQIDQKTFEEFLTNKFNIIGNNFSVIQSTMATLNKKVDTLTVNLNTLAANLGSLANNVDGLAGDTTLSFKSVDMHLEKITGELFKINTVTQYDSQVINMDIVKN